MSWWVVVNPMAGAKGEIEQRTRAALTKRRIDHEIRVSRSADDIPNIVAEGRSLGATRFVAVGGDGTTSMVLNGMLAEGWLTPPTLAVLPIGSGSDFIRTFALPRHLEDAADHLVTADVYRCDVGVLEGNFGRRYFLNVADVGIAAASLRIANVLPRFLGGLRYGISFWLKLAFFPSAIIRMEADGRSYEGPAINVVVANGQYFGGGMNVAPRATVMDGKLDIQIFVGPRRHAFSVMPRVIRGSHLTHRSVRRFEAETFEIECIDGWPVEADGELIGSGSVIGRVAAGAIDFKI